MSRKSRSGSGSSPAGPLLQSRGQLEARTHSVSLALAKLLGASSASLQAHIEFVAQAAVTELQGAATEHIRARNWGRGTHVTELCDLGAVGPAWVGLREKWEFAETRGNRPFYAFESASITVYAGEAGAVEKAQILRAEWAGFLSRGGIECFQAGEAGHPHWQIDVFETLRGMEEDAPRFGELPPARPFSAGRSSEDYKTNLKATPFERFHFASGAHWWLPDSEGASRQQHTPRDDADVTRWILGSISYIREQLQVVARGMG